MACAGRSGAAPSTIARNARRAAPGRRAHASTKAARSGENAEQSTAPASKNAERSAERGSPPGAPAAQAFADSGVTPGSTAEAHRFSKPVRSTALAPLRAVRTREFYHPGPAPVHTFAPEAPASRSRARPADPAAGQEAHSAPVQRRPCRIAQPAGNPASVASAASASSARPRLPRKKSVRIAPHSSARTPPVTWTR